MLIIVFVCTAGFTQPLTTNSFLIQAEDFTEYEDHSHGNYDLVYRTDVGVDINFDHDPYWYEGIRVMAIEDGETLTYEIDVPVTGTWNITFNGNINFDLYFDETLFGQGFGTPLDYKGDFRFNLDNIVYGVELTEGLHTMKIEANTSETPGEVQLDYIWFTSDSDPLSSPPVAPQPYDDTTPPPAPSDYVSPVSQYGQLYVDGPNIKSSKTGENVQLRFLAISSPKWFPTIKNNTIYNLAYHEHVQGIRLAMYAEDYTWDDPDMRPYLKDKTLEIINECIDAGIYLEISYHTHATDFRTDDYDDENECAYDMEMAFYQWLSDYFAAKEEQPPPNLIFGIINEIASDTITWDIARPYAQEFVYFLRTTFPDNIILCGTPFWSQNPQDVIDKELDGSNIVYTFHMYTAEHQMSIADNIITCYDAGIPLWANEISPGHYDWQLWSYDFTHFAQLIYILESRDISWTNWAWSLKGEALSALYWDSPFYGPWKNSELTEGGRFIRNMINDYLVNTDFSDGADCWFLNNWQKSGAEVEFDNEEAHIFYNDVASQDNFGQQFTIENIRIVNGITYTISFDARSAAPRTITVDVSENGGDYLPYGSSDTFAISTTLTSYTFSFTMNNKTDDLARMVFNVGASIDDIWFDNITVHYSELEEPGKEKDDVVVLCENFSGDSDWDFNPWQPSLPCANIEYANNEAHITFSALEEDPWGQQLSTFITLEQGASYVVHFDAKSTAPRPLNINIGNSETSESYTAKDFVLSTNMAPYSLRFTQVAEATENDTIQFNLGTDIHDVWLDNVRIIKYNRLLNGDFSLAGENWAFNPWEPFWPCAKIEYANNEAHVTFLEIAPHDYGQQLSNNLILETGESYIVSFDARSLEPRPLRVLVTNDTYYYPADFILSATMEKYEYRFIMDEEISGNDMIRFDLGTDKNDIWLDNVVVRKSENIIGNGCFSNNAEHWSSGFHEDSVGNAGIIAGEFVVDVISGGSQDWHIQILQANVALNKGKHYFVEFEARTDAARDITVNIGSGVYSNPDPYTSYSGAPVFSLDTEMRNYSFEFTMNENDHNDARCEFNLGLFDSDVIIDNVRIIEIIKISDDFQIENDSGNWLSNGEDCYWNTLYRKRKAFYTMNIQGADGAMELQNTFDAADAETIKIDFSYYVRGYKFRKQYGGHYSSGHRCYKRYNWDVQFTRDHGQTWDTIFTWPEKNRRMDLVNESIILNSSDYDFTDECNFRFQSNGKNKNDDVFIDSVTISIYRGDSPALYNGPDSENPRPCHKRWKKRTFAGKHQYR